MTQAKDLSDFFIQVWPTIFILDLFRYLVAASLMASILLLFARQLATRRIQSRRAGFQDIKREITFSLSTVFLFSLVGFAVYASSQAGFFKIYGGDLPNAGRLLIEFVAVVLLHDTYFYWAHRLMHTRWLFRRIHKAHHRSRTPTPWAAYAFAPAEAVLEAGILPVIALLIPMHELTVLLFVTHMIIRNVIGHAGVEIFPSWWLRTSILRRVTTTIHHDLHHSHGGYNFGLYFTWWDRWMNTEHPEYEYRFTTIVPSRCRLQQASKETTK